MNERLREIELGEERRAHQLGVEAVADEFADLRPPPPVEIALYVNGRLVNTKTDSDTVMKIMALLTGLGG